MFDTRPDEKEAVGQPLDAMSDRIDIIGISFRSAGKVYYFASNGVTAAEGDHAIVETARGQEYGTVTLSNRMMPKNELVLPLRKVLRLANKEDEERHEANRQKEEEAFRICQEKIANHKLDMKLIDVEYTFDNSKLLFYFTSDDRVDFRELVKDLASIFRTRIELRQIGIRDEAKLMGGLGVCGREFCCHSFLGDFAQVTIKMAKEQNLSLNSAKISGACGKLMCCLRYEHEAYQAEIKLTPKVDSLVLTPDGPGVVTETKPLQGLVRVKLDSEGDDNIRIYHRDDLSPYVRSEGEPKKVERRTERSDARNAISPAPRKSERRSERSSERAGEKTADRSTERKEKRPDRPDRPAERSEKRSDPSPDQRGKKGEPNGGKPAERRDNRDRRKGRPPMEKHTDRQQEKKPQKNAKND